MTHDEIREIYRGKRRKLKAEQCIYYSEEITKNFLSNWSFKNKVINCFLPILRLKEVETNHLINVLKHNNQICVPVCNFGPDNLTHKMLTEHTVFQDNSLGIPEPLNGDDVLPKDIDVVIVPLLAVDQHGNRLGYGKGFYDRFLSDCRDDAIFVGLTMFDIHEDLENMEPHDVPLHYVVTPKGILDTRRKKVAQ